jgi:hypothetical protein
MTATEALAKIDDYTGMSVTPETKIEDLGLDSLELLDLSVTLGEGSAQIPNYNGETNTVADLIAQACS